MSSGPMLPVEQIATRLYGPPDGDRAARAACERVRLLIRSKALPARKVGKRWFVHVDNLDAFERGVDNPEVMRHPAGRAAS
jgi:nucleoside-diphosphate-sugar epimerase